MHLNPKVGSYWASVYRNVKSIEKTGPMEVTVTLTQPDSMFNQYMAVSPGTIESKAFLEQAGRRLRQPEHGRRLHRAVRVRLVEVRPEHHPQALRRLLGPVAEGQVRPR